MADAERAAKARSAQDLNSVRLEARKRVAAVKERAVREVFDDARSSLGSVRERDDYAAIFRALVDEAVEGVEGEYDLLVDPADAEIARQIVAEKGFGCRRQAGAILGWRCRCISLQGGSVTRRNTLEDRLDKLRGLAQADVAGLLFA